VSTGPAIRGDIDLPHVVAQVRAELDRYEAALVANDIGTLVEQFWDDDATMRIGPGETLHGACEITAFRLGRPPRDVARSVDRVTITTFGEDVGLATVEFTRTSTGRQGRQSQTWVRFPQGWRVVHAHVSLSNA
jgi:ketosteroid isomerase-like protein